MLLLTIAPSHYCEKAAWALDRAGVPYQEQAHAPILHMLPIKRATGATSTPALLLDDGTCIQDSTAILQWIEAHPSSGWRPYEGAADALLLEDSLDLTLGPAVRRVAYYHLLSDLGAVRRLAATWNLGWESTVFSATAPVMAWLLRRGLNITTSSAARSLAKVQAVFDDVDARLADGRPWLCGDRFSAADLTFTALAAPVLLPEDHPRLPGIDAAPPSLQAVARELRARPAGALALRAYASERS